VSANESTFWRQIPDTWKQQGDSPMTEEARKAVDRLRHGHPIECSADAYRSEIRDAIIRFALDCVDSNETGRMRIALAEVNRLDKEYCYGLPAESPDRLA